MTNLTVAEVYAIGLPIIYGMIALEAIFSSLTNKSFYRLDDTLCTAGLLIGNILIGSAAKGLSFAVHILLYVKAYDKYKKLNLLRQKLIST